MNTLRDLFKVGIFLLVIGAVFGGMYFLRSADFLKSRVGGVG